MIGIRTRIDISIYFALVVSCALVLDRTGIVLYALLCIALHETGHLVVIRMLKIPLEEISFRLFGIHLRVRNNVTVSYRQEIAVSLAGCGANLLFALFFFLLERTGAFRATWQILCMFNLLLAGFNILPIGPLDGGRALEAALCIRLKLKTAEAIVTAVSVFFLIPLVLAGVFLLRVTKYNGTLIFAAAYLAASLFLKGQLLVRPGTHRK